MLPSNWLRGLPWGAFGGARRSTVQVGVIRTATELVAVRVRLDPDGYLVERWEAASIKIQTEQAAAEQLARSGIFRSAPAVLVLGREHYHTYPVQAPDVPPSEMRDALRWRLRDMLGFPPEEAAVDFVPLARGDASGEADSLLAVAAPRRAVAQSIEPFTAAHIDVQAADIAEMALRNLLNRLPGPEAGRALLGLDESSALLAVVYQGELCFARRFQISHSPDDAEDDPEHGAARIATQVQRSLEVVERQAGLPAIRTVWIGPHPYCALIARSTAEQGGLECPQLEIQAELRFAEGARALPPELEPAALLAIGAALGVPRNINLLERPRPTGWRSPEA
ncbi:MAG: hypothetical protein JOZ15_09975, partial [Acidobacteria bacterium]|nr:hypothetical protein [Acidobacteriota bacterium]